MEVNQELSNTDVKHHYESNSAHALLKMVQGLTVTNSFKMVPSNLFSPASGAKRGIANAPE